MCFYQRANEEKEQKIAVMDEGRCNMQKENGDLRASLREVERSRLEARRELQELRRQVSNNLIFVKYANSLNSINDNFKLCAPHHYLLTRVNELHVYSNKISNSDFH